MGLLFVLALLLAWPTSGLSILAWIAIYFFKSKKKVDKIVERDNRKLLIEPLFGNKFAEFFMALDMPKLNEQRFDYHEAHKCGRHIMTYLAHNPEEGSLFLQGLKKWQTKGSQQLCDPVTAAQSERDYDAKGEIHLVSYRAVESLMKNNKSLTCFRPIDFDQLVLGRIELEMNSMSAL